jgi:hypothetical protein
MGHFGRVVNAQPPDSLVLDVDVGELDPGGFLEIRRLAYFPLDRDPGDAYVRILPTWWNGFDDPLADIRQTGIGLVKDLLDLIETIQFLGPLGEKPD